MSYYEQRLSVDLNAIRKGVYDLGTQVEHALSTAALALLTRDHALASQTIIGDHPINREAERLSMECHYFIARHLPSASHLRSISSALRMILLLERMGDYAVTICRESVQLNVPLSGVFRSEVEDMSAEALRMYNSALDAYLSEDGELAKKTIGWAKRVDRQFYTAYKLLVDENVKDLDMMDLFGRLVIISQFERVGDQAKNLCEETVFALSGQTKQRQPVRILFVDGDDSSFAYLAAAIGQNGFADRASFFCHSGFDTSKGRPEINHFLSTHGLDSGELDSRVLSVRVPTWEDYEVIVILNGSHAELINRVPFHSVAFDWWISRSAGDDVSIEDAYRYLRESIENLVHIYRGESIAIQ